MAITVDAEELKDLVNTSADSSTLSLFAAHGVSATTDLLGAESALSAETKDIIALYLAAHFYTLSREHGGLRRQRIGQSEDEFKPVAADKVGFLSTRFGQAAIALDTTRTLLNSSFQWNAEFGFEVIRSSGHD